jgi:hypothetical protein
VVLLPHQPGHARAQGKQERGNRFFQDRVLADGPYARVAALDAALQEWLGYDHTRHQHRTRGAVPAARLAGSEPRALLAAARPLADLGALRAERKGAKDHPCSLDGQRYTLPREPNLVAFTVELRIRPGPTVRVWHHDQCIAELPHGETPPPDGLSVADRLERVRPRTEPKGPHRPQRSAASCRPALPCVTVPVTVPRPPGRGSPARFAGPRARRPAPTTAPTPASNAPIAGARRR